MFTKQRGFHILAWAVFVLSESAIAFMALSPEKWWSFLVFTLPEVLLFYGHFKLLRYFLTKTKSAVKILLLVLGVLVNVLIFCAVVIAMRIGLNIVEENGQPLTITKIYIASALFRSFLILTLSTAYWLTENYIRHTKEINRMELESAREKLATAILERDVAKANSAWLRARLKPHLIFNTLNFVQSKVMENPEATRSIRLLTGLLRYSMEEPEEDGLVNLTKEWSQVEEYVQLHQMRFERTVHVQLDLDNSNAELRIPPLILLSLIENVYKHAELFDPAHVAQFSFVTRQKGWEIHVRNKKKKSKYALEKSGVGIESIRSSLSKTYGSSNYTINIAEQENDYALNLTVNLKTTPDL